MKDMEQGSQTSQGDPDTKGSGFVNQQETTETIGDRFKIDGRTDPSGNLHQLSLTATDFAKEILNRVPVGRERHNALTNLEQCFFWLNAGLTRHNVPYSKR
jgi:hypothetical protein